MSILVVGTVALDTIQTPFGKVKEVLGGSATYSAVSASLFTKARLVGIVGKDFPQRFVTFLQSRNIDTEGLEIKKGKTFRWHGYYTYDLNNPKTLKTELNVLSRFNPRLPHNYLNEQFIFLANIDPDIQLAVLAQLKKPKLVVSDTMNYWIENKKDTLRRVIKRSDILLLNDAEARQYTGSPNLIKAARIILAQGPRLVIIKRGEYGCSLFSRSFSFYIPAYLLEDIADPTGAGDTFAGAFLGYLSSCPMICESSFRKAIVYGTIMASYAVEDFSLNRLSKLNKKDIDGRFREFQRLTKF